MAYQQPREDCHRRHAQYSHGRRDVGQCLDVEDGEVERLPQRAGEDEEADTAEDDGEEKTGEPEDAAIEDEGEDIAKEESSKATMTEED